MKLKIISDGSAAGTKLIDTETDEQIGFVQKIEWEVGVDNPFASCVVKFIKIPVELSLNQNNIKFEKVEIIK